VYAAIEIKRSGAAGVDRLALTTPFLSLSFGVCKGENERELGCFGFRVRVEGLCVWWNMQGRRRAREAIFFKITSW
jgi:hypothetical protein